MTRVCAKRAFREWPVRPLRVECGQHASTGQQCLAHKLGNKATQAYLHSTMMVPRRKVMQKWADYLDGKVEVESDEAKVVRITERR